MTGFLEVMILGLVLSADSFSVALALGARPHTRKQALTFATSSGGAEALLTFIGAMAGANLVQHFSSFGHWVSFFLLFLVALHMTKEGFDEWRGLSQNQPQNFHSIYKILAVSFASSLDAFAVGVSLGIEQKSLTAFVLSIGLWAFFSTILGVGIAKRASKKMGPLFIIFGSIILMLLALKFLIEGLA